MSSAATQLDLSGIEQGWELLTVEADKASGRFTADLIAKNQGKLATVIEALAQGLSIRAIAKGLGISVNTVLAVKRIHGEKIETEKQRLGRDCFDVARMAIERMRDEMQDMPRASLPIIAGVMADKGLLLTGAPTSRIEHTGGVQVLSVAEYIASLPAAKPVCTQENPSQKGELIELDQGARRSAVDPQSTDSGLAVEGKPSDGQESGQNAAQKDRAP